MTRYLLATWEGGGNIPPELGIARGLIARGHTVHVLADPATETAARAAGCTFSPWVTAPHRRSLAPEEDVIRDWEYKNPLALFKRLLDVFVAGPVARFASDTAAVLDAHPADVVIGDMMMFGAMMVAEARKLPRVHLVPNCSMRPARGVPPFGPGFMPARGPLGKLRDALLRTMSNRLWRRALPPINAARSSLGLPPIADFWSQYDLADRVFIQTSPSFDFVSPELPQNVRYTGPVLDDPSWAGATWSPPWDPANTDPIVLVGLSSTYQDQLGTLRNVVAALAPLPIRALVTLGPSLAPDAVAAPSPNIAIVSTAPHALVLPHARLAITHCGHGTTMRALAAGVPLVCVPMGRDQEDTAARVVARGAGVRLKRTASAARIRRAALTVLAEQRFATAARALADAFVREARDVDAIAEIEALSAPIKTSRYSA